MNTFIRTATAVAVGVGAVALFATSGSADDFKVEDGYTALFNGKDLTGWSYKKEQLDGKTETSDGRFKWVDGVLVVADIGKFDIKDLNSTRVIEKPFHLKLEFRAGLKADSGVYVRGPQLQIRDFIRRGEQKALAKFFKNDDWNELDITVGGAKTILMVNNKALDPTDVFELSVKQGAVLGKLNGKDLDVAAFSKKQAVDTVCKLNGEVFDKGFTAGVKGVVGLQAELGKFEYRRVRIKEMN
jgi:hypothetical protein